ncbi:MAG: hypothetical protein ACRENQ_02870 [Gemmatimonadaceae bacterium]
MSRPLTLAGALLIAACASPASHASQTPAPATPAEARRPLGNLAEMRIIVTPVFRLDEGDPLGWAAKIPRARVMLHELDSAIVAEFDARGLGGTWYFAPALEKAYELNATYAANPHMLAEAPLLGALELGKTYGEPLATQLRTMIAMQDGARRVLLPVDVRFEKAADGTSGVAVMKLVLVDARTTEFLWVHDVRSDPAPAFGPAVLRSLANHFADLVAAP